MRHVQAPKVRRFTALLLDLGFENRTAFAASIKSDVSALARLLHHDYGPDGLRNRAAKALGLSRADFDAITQNEVRISRERRGKKAVTS